MFGRPAFDLAEFRLHLQVSKFFIEQKTLCALQNPGNPTPCLPKKSSDQIQFTRISPTVFHPFLTSASPQGSPWGPQGFHHHPPKTESSAASSPSRLNSAGGATMGIYQLKEVGHYWSMGHPRPTRTRKKGMVHRKTHQEYGDCWGDYF